VKAMTEGANADRDCPGTAVSSFPIVEISDPDAVPVPGFDRVEVTCAEL